MKERGGWQAARESEAQGLARPPENCATLEESLTSGACSIHLDREGFGADF